MNEEYDINRPSEKIKALAYANHLLGDINLNNGEPTVGEFIVAIMQYLDEQYNINKLK